MFQSLPESGLTDVRTGRDPVGEDASEGNMKMALNAVLFKRFVTFIV